MDWRDVVGDGVVDLEMIEILVQIFGREWFAWKICYHLRRSPSRRLSATKAVGGPYTSFTSVNFQAV